jgi:hypothetical protein
MKKALAAIFGFLLASALLAQPVDPGDIWGTVFESVLPTLSNFQQTIWSSNNNGKLNVTGIGGGSPQFLLLVAGPGNFVLQTNAVAKICLAGTC